MWAWVGGWLEAQLSRVTPLSTEESCALESLRICLFGVLFQLLVSVACPFFTHFTQREQSGFLSKKGGGHVSFPKTMLRGGQGCVVVVEGGWKWSGDGLEVRVGVTSKNVLTGVLRRSWIKKGG